MTRFNLFSNEELDAMEEVFRYRGLTHLIDEIRREKRYREVDSEQRSEET